MNPYRAFSQLLFTCVDAPPTEIVNTVLAGFNAPVLSNVEQAFREGAKEVQIHEEGVSKVYKPGDSLPPRKTSIQYFAKEVPLDFSLAYVDHAEQDTTKEHRILFWEPRVCPSTTAFMGAFDDGMCHSVWSLSQDSPNTWINVRIYDNAEYPGCFFDYYSDYRKVLRRLMACRDETGWDFALQGPIQLFENAGYYARRLKRDRLNREIISEYMESLGYLIAQDAFWETDKPAHFIWQERPSSIGD